MRYFILAQSECTATALGSWVELLSARAHQSGTKDEGTLVFDSSTIQEEDGVIAYESLVKRIEKMACMADGSIALNEVTVLVDSVRPSAFDVMSDGASWDQLIAMLILTFPEIRWVFGVIQGNRAGFPTENHDLFSLLASPRRDPLFDPTGLRDFVRSVTNKYEQGRHKGDPKSCFAIPLRRERAAAIDEEHGFAYFHSYVAYRYGFRSDAVTSWSLMKHLFGQKASHGCFLLMEDVNLNFPDKAYEIHLSDLRQRAGACAALSMEHEESALRALITGNAQVESCLKNAKYLRNCKGDRQTILSKPAGGMMDLWAGLGLYRYLGSRQKPGYAPGFAHNEERREGGRHSAPGKLKLMAETMLRRAETFRGAACTIKDYLKGAVLCLDASELLGGMTPLLSYTALERQHEYEVKAECVFIGNGSHFDVKRRHGEFVKSIQRITPGEGPRQRMDMASVEERILNRLVLVFRSEGQFDEELECLSLQRRARRAQRRTTTTTFDKASECLYSYAEWLLEGASRLPMVILTWLGLSTLLWWAFQDSSCEDRPLNFLRALAGAANAFVGGGSDATNNSIAVLSSLLALAGLFHFGVFVSYLYTKVSRR